jgi:hypothetical protein
MFRDLNRANHAIDLQAPAKATADQVVVDHNLVQRQAGGFRGDRLNAGNHLATDPNFTTVLAKPSAIAWS